jgi:hypothetical protein
MISLTTSETLIPLPSPPLEFGAYTAANISFPRDETEAAGVELDELDPDAFVVAFNKLDVAFEESKELRSDASEDVELMISP